MHSLTALLYIIFIAHVCSATAQQDAKILKQHFKIEINLYSESDCKGNFSIINDLTKFAQESAFNENWFISYAFISSFQLIDRNLEDQEQLDISAMALSIGDKCDVFIRSYFADIITECNNVKNITCVRLWNNADL